MPIAMDGSSKMPDQPMDPKLKNFHKNQEACINTEEEIQSDPDLQNQSDIIMSRAARLTPENKRGPYK